MLPVTVAYTDILHHHFPRAHRGKGLAAFLKAIGYLIPLMDNESAKYYTKEVMVILIREFQSPDEEMRKIVLKVCVFKYMSVYSGASDK